MFVSQADSKLYFWKSFEILCGVRSCQKQRLVLNGQNSSWDVIAGIQFTVFNLYALIMPLSR